MYWCATHVSRADVHVAVGGTQRAPFASCVGRRASRAAGTEIAQWYGLVLAPFMRDAKLQLNEGRDNRSGWVHRPQLIVIEFLQAENHLHKEERHGKRVRFSDGQRALLTGDTHEFKISLNTGCHCSTHMCFGGSTAVGARSYPTKARDEGMDL